MKGGYSWSYDGLTTLSNQELESTVTSLTKTLSEEHTRVVLSKRFIANIQGDALALYRQLRKKTPAPYMYFVTFDVVLILCWEHHLKV
ncbi:Anthranilate synthase component 1 OS=Lysinibacillus sphaericus OX=1421 GN=LS41612_07375 PE=4 SV=1 [Lysinibacillus sphaericus]